MPPASLPEKGARVRRIADGIVGEVYSSDPKKGLVDVRWRGRSGSGTLLCAPEEFYRDWELTKKSDFNRKGLTNAIVFPVIFGICFYVWLKACESPPVRPVPSPPAPTSRASTPDAETSDPPAKLMECIESHDDGVKSDVKLYGECAEEVVAWIKGCLKSGGGDERTCSAKSVDVLRMTRIFKKEWGK